MTPKYLPVMYTNTALYRSYTLRRHLRHLQGALPHDWKLIKYTNLQK